MSHLVSSDWSFSLSVDEKMIKKNMLWFILVFLDFNYFE